MKTGLSFKLPQSSCPELQNSLSGLSLGSSLKEVAGAPIKTKFSIITWFISFFLTPRLFTFK